MVAKLERKESKSSRSTSLPPHFLARFLQAHRRHILDRWLTECSRMPLGPELSFLREQNIALETVFDQFQLLVKANSGRVASIAAPAALLEVRSVPGRDDLLVEVVRVFSTFAEIVAKLLRETPAYRRVSARARKDALQRLDCAWSILIHREIHAFAENCSRLLTGFDLDQIVRHTCFTETSLGARVRSA